MTIGVDFITDPLNEASQGIPFIEVNPVTGAGVLTQQAVEFLRQLRDYVSGMSRVIPCDASGTNTISLTPTSGAPQIQRYNSHDIFVARVVATSTGDVSATVVPEHGTMSTLPVYKAAGVTRATTGDVVADSLYLFVFADYLNAGAGGFVLK